MNKRAARILILFLVFAASVGVFTHLMSHETTENATDLDARRTPPKVKLVIGGEVVTR